MQTFNELNSIPGRAVMTTPEDFRDAVRAGVIMGSQDGLSVMDMATELAGISAELFKVVVEQGGGI